MTTPSITELRQAIGLKTPNWQQKQLIWSRVTSETGLFTGGYKPGPTAARAHQSDARAIGISGGAGAGKSLLLGMEGLTWVPFTSLIWIMAYKYAKARPEFLYLSEGAVSTGLCRRDDVHLPTDEDKPCSLYSIPHDSPGGMVRCQVQTMTLRDYQKQAAARRPDLIIVCEPGLIDDLGDMEATLWGRLTERRGRLLAGGTSEESSEDWFHMLTEWSTPNNDMGGEVYILPTWENERVYPLGEKEPVLLAFRKRWGEELYQMRYGGVPAPPKGLVLKGYFGDHLIDDDLEFDPGLPLEVFIDPNYMDPARYVIGFIQWNEQTSDFLIVDEIAAEGCSHPEMIERFREHPLSRYVLGGEIDPHAGDHHPSGAESPMDHWRHVIPDLRCGTRQIPVRTTVQALKQAMTERPGGLRPRLRIARRCERGIYEGSHWKLTSQGKPRETNCDFLKALGYWLVRRFAHERAQAETPDNIIRPSEYNWGGRWGGRIGNISKAELDYEREFEEMYG